MTQLQSTKGSLQERQSQSKLTMAEAFLTVEAICIVDISSSMATQDVNSEGGRRSRWSEANVQLTRLQAKFPGKLAVVAFSDRAEFCPSGTLPPTQGGTNMLGALQFVSAADGAGIKFIVVSDGCSDNDAGTLAYAKTMVTGIDTIYIGSDPRGKQFMEALARAGRGKSITKGVELLEESVTLLLGDGK